MPGWRPVSGVAQADPLRPAAVQGAAGVPKVTRIGVVSVGRMGLPMCANLVAAGHMVTAGDARAELERAPCGNLPQPRGPTVSASLTPRWAATRRSWTGAAGCWKRSPTRNVSSASAATTLDTRPSCWLTCCGSARPWLPARACCSPAAPEPTSTSSARRWRPARHPTAFVRDDLGALLDGDYLMSFGLDRCCEELTAIADLARELRVPSQLTQVVEQTYQRALRRFGPVDGELLAVALLEEEAGLRLRHGPA